MIVTMYVRKSRLTPRQQSKLIEDFVAGSTARASAEVVGVQANTAIRFFMRLRQLISSKLPSYRLSGEIEADESYFGGVRKGKRGRGAGGKVAVFGLLKRGGKVYTARSYPTPRRRPCCRSSRRKRSLTALSTRIPSGLITRWMSPTFITAGSITQSSSPISKTISMGSRISGTRQSVTCASTTASNPIISTGF